MATGISRSGFGWGSRRKRRFSGLVRLLLHMQEKNMLSNSKTLRNALMYMSYTKPYKLISLKSDVSP
jgi:hypothetical protein